MSGRIPQDGFFASELSLSLRKVRFNKQKFPISKLILDIKYHHLDFQNNNLFYLFNDQLDYILANYFTESEITKNNVDRFLFDLLIAPLT